MPVPKPNSGESQSDYMGRCMHFLAHESDTERSNDQMVAICMNIWKDHGKAQVDEDEPYQTDDADDKAEVDIDEPYQTDEDDEDDPEKFVTPPRSVRVGGKGELTVPLEIKSLRMREFEGYGSVFGNKDLGGDVVVQGAFEKSLAQHKDSGTMPQMFWMHDPSRVPGKWLGMKEDQYGLYVHGQLAPTPLGDEMHALIKMDAVRGLSIGYMVTDDAYDKQGTRLLKAVDLWETSIVSMAMNPFAQVTHAKSHLSPRGEYVPSPRECEQLFRSAGWSKSVARRAVAKLFADLDAGETPVQVERRLFGKDAPGARPGGSRWDAGDSELARALDTMRDRLIASCIKKY